jgi:signal transduction histidine kinase
MTACETHAGAATSVSMLHGGRVLRSRRLTGTSSSELFGNGTGVDGAKHTTSYVQAMERLIAVVQQLSLARDLDTLMGIVRTAARELTGADGATFILREGDRCFYADEDAIAPLWKGRRFPMTSCISGWAMIHRREAVIEDVTRDARVPQDAYRPTFVKSLLVVPIRNVDPVGAIGNYWAARHQPRPEEIKLLQALADTTAVALENIQVYAELERRVQARTAELETLNHDLDSFCHSVSHDLRAPVRAIGGFCNLIAKDHGTGFDAEIHRKLGVIKSEAGRMGTLIDDLLAFSRLGRKALKTVDFDMTEVARRVFDRLQRDRGDKADTTVDFRLANLPAATGDVSLFEQVWINLMSNALKFSSKRMRPSIEIGGSDDGHDLTYWVRDNGAGFDQQHAAKLFQPFQRLHSDGDYPGTGIGLALVHRIVSRHGGRVWAIAAPEAGATFFFTLPRKHTAAPAN